MSPTNYLNTKNGIEILHDSGTTQIIAGDVDPITIGVTANVGSLYLHINGNHYKKTGPNDTNWVILVEEAPEDGNLYGRRNNDWLEFDTAVGNSPGGPEDAVQFNYDNTFSGSQNFKYERESNRLTVSNLFIEPDGEKVGLWVL